ncbi:hypothetical protein PC112_g20608 [Phytophthora cactorum]|nr:hypothetical protein PC112_g20608 [Phytophthora cactorum]KAG2887599.1 hypothetical protein PC115_g20290 [Phytophthora cactorum]
MDAASEPASTTPQVSTPQRRKNYSEEDDVTLLRQVLLDRPFAKPRGKLVLTHREATKEAALLSGVAEEVLEKDQLLDELAELLDDAKYVHECTKREEQKKRRTLLVVLPWSNWSCPRLQ